MPTTITVEIDSRTLEVLLSGQYNLCFLSAATRDVKSGENVEQGNVVFDSIVSNDLASNVEISIQKTDNIVNFGLFWGSGGTGTGSKIDLSSTAVFYVKFVGKPIKLRYGENSTWSVL